jgi:PAS domain S-box-containing protein
MNQHPIATPAGDAPARAGEATSSRAGEAAPPASHAPAPGAEPPRAAVPPGFAALAQLAATLCQVPLGAIVIKDEGVLASGTNAAQLERLLRDADPFDAPTGEAEDVFEVPNIVLDRRFNHCACATGALALRAYAGCALRSTRGEVLGRIAVYNTAARKLTPAQRQGLKAIAQQCAAQLELRARVAELEMAGGAALGRNGHAPQTGSSSLAMNPIVTGAPPEDPQVLRAVLDSAPVAIYRSDPSSAIGYVNCAYRRIFNLKPDQTVDDWALGVHPEDRARMEATWAEFCRDPQPSRFEYRTQDAEGNTRYFEELVVPIDGASGFVGTIADFTELVTARGDLRKAETLHRDTFDQAPLGIVYSDRSGRFQRVNAAFCSLVGRTAVELGGAVATDITHGEDAPAAALQLERLWNGDIGLIDTEKRYVRKDGSFVWVRTTTALVRAGTASACSVEYVRDISHRKELAAALLQQQTLLEAVISDLPVALLACDVHGNVTHFNRAAVELQCVQPHERVDTEATDSFARIADVYLIDGVTPVPAEDLPLMRALRGETISNLELVIAPKHGPRRTTLSSARRLVGPEGQTLGAVAVIQDTTQRKQQELELERAHKELVTASRQAGMAEVATNVLHNVGNILNSVNISASLVAERLRQSKVQGITRLAALLGEQGERLGTFMAEDERGKRVPQYLSALGEQLQGDQRVALEEITALRENLEHIKDTVAMQQSYAKRLGVTETVEVVDLVEDSLRLNAGAFARHGVTLRREFSPVPAIHVDRHKVLQILVNLIRNAKYACDDAGKPEKLITLKIEPSERGVRIAVIDNGIGIAPEHMGRLFTHGFTTRQSGHGFGLHSGALAARELGATLHAESDGPGQGASFILDLPLGTPNAAGS